MKCPSCGAQMGLENKFCPYCGSPNTQAIKHQMDMDRFEGDYLDTKEHVFRRTELIRNRGGLLIIMVVILIAMIIGVILNAKAWDIGYSIREKSVDGHRKEDLKALGEYLEQGEYGKFYGYYRSNYINYDSNYEYYEIESVASRYIRLFEAVSAIDNPADYSFHEDRISESCLDLAEDLIYIYSAKDEYKRSQDGLTEESQGYLNDIQERSGLIAKTYFGLTDEQLEDITNMSKSKLAVLIEEGIRK